MTLSLHRRRPAVDTVESLRHQLDQERAHSAHLALRVAEQDETIRHLVEGRDHYRGQARDLVGQVVNLRAQVRAARA